MADSLNTLDFSTTGNVAVGNVATEELPYAADVVGVTATVATAPVGADIVLDVTKNGTSIFTGLTLGTIAPSSSTSQGAGGGLAVGDTRLSFEVAGNGDLDVKVGETLLIDTELVQVTAVAGSQRVDNSNSVYTLTITRGYDGTTAAAHAANAQVFAGRPRIIAGQTQSVGPSLARVMELPQFNQGDVLAVSVSQVGSTTAGANLGVVIELDQR